MSRGHTIFTYKGKGYGYEVIGGTVVTFPTEIETGALEVTRFDSQEKNELAQLLLESGEYVRAEDIPDELIEGMMDLFADEGYITADPDSDFPFSDSGLAFE